MNEITITHCKPAELIPYPHNARRHSEEQIAQLMDSIAEFGFTNPVLADGSRGVIAGHGRLLAAQRLELETVPVIELAHLSENQKRAYILADNRLAELGSWDEDLLREQLLDLRHGDPDLVRLVGFAEAQLDALFANDAEGLTDEDAIPGEERGLVVTRAGDLWLLGEHRLLCANSTDEQAVARLMDGQRAVLMATDPPYGVSHVATKDGIPRLGFADMAKRWEHIKNDDLKDHKLQEFLERAFRAALKHALTENAAWYLWHAHLTQGFFAAAAADLLLHRQVIWKKPCFVLTRSGQYHWAHESCFYGWRRGYPPPWYGDKSRTSVWEMGAIKAGCIPRRSRWRFGILRSKTTPGTGKSSLSRLPAPARR